MAYFAILKEFSFFTGMILIVGASNYDISNISGIGLIAILTVAIIALLYLIISFHLKNKKLKEQVVGLIKEKETKKTSDEIMATMSNERLKFTLAGAMAGSLLFDCKTSKLTLDNRSFEILGIQKENFHNSLTEWFDMIDPDEAGTFESNFYDGIKNKHFWEKNFNIKSDNLVKNIKLQCYVDRDEKRIPLSVYGMMTDITEKTKKELKLSENEERFRLIFEKSKDGIILMDLNGDIITANPSAGKILEIDIDEILGKKYDELNYNFIRENGKELNQEEWPPYVALFKGKEVKEKMVGMIMTNKIKWLKVDALPLFKEGNLWPYLIYVHFKDVTQEHRMINELQRSENKYRNLSDNSLIGIFRGTPRGEISYINRSLSKILELESQIDVIGENPMKFFANNKDRRFFYQSLKDNVTVENLETVLITSKGNVKNVVLNAQWINDGITGMVLDITEIIEARDELKRNRENFKQIFNSMQEGYLQFNTKGKIITHNPSALRILGYSNENGLDGKNVKKMVFKTIEVFEETLKLLEHKKTLASYPIEFIKKNKKVITADCNIHYIRSSNNKTTVIECTFRDITYRKLVDEAIKSLLNLNRIMETCTLNQMVDLGLEEAVRLTNSNIGFFHFVNENTASISLQAWSKQTIQNCEVPEKIEHYPIDQAGIWVDCIRYRKPVIHNDYKNAPNKKGLPNGHFPLVREMVVPIFESKKIVAVIGVGNKEDGYNEFDIDQLSLLGENIWSIIRRKKAEDEIIISKEIAESANKSKSVFLANISHEIRTPLNAVIGFSELLMKQIEDPVQKNYIESIKSSGNTLLEIINDILDLSKIEAGRMNVSPEPSNIEDLITNVRNIFSLKAQQKHLDFTFHLPGKTPYLFNIDELRVRQILINLVGNAIKFTNEGFVRIYVEVKKTNKKRNMGDLTFCIEDSGIGITDDALSSIFESFKQQDEQDVKKYGGTGLGLAISKRLAELMNGDITVESIINEGSRFYLTLKNVELTKRDLIEKEEEHTSDQKIEFSDSTILVIDDIVVNRELIKGIFKEHKVKVIEAANGKEGLHMAKQYQPDLIFMDIRMPVMDGYEATNELKSDPELSHIPVVALTASLSAERNPEEMAKFNGFLKKPVTVKRILQETKRFIPYNKTLSTIEKNEFKLPVFNAEMKKQLPELMDTINNEILNYWQKVKDADNMDDIKNFTEKLIDTGNRYKLDFLVEYGNDLNKYALSFDIEKIMILLNTFPKIKNSLQKI